jgi:murein DD-endopeptidase MepM/ murein hydrolase activator NlpD
MNLIVLCRGTSGTRHLTLSTPVLATLAMAVLAVLLGSFGLGYGVARARGYLPADERLGALQAQLRQQQAELGRTREAADGYLASLAVRLGELNAHVIRLNALGARLAEMAHLDDGEFDFGAKPAYGGPDDGSGDALPETTLTAEFEELATRIERQDLQLELLSSLLLDRRLSDATRPRGYPVLSGYISSHFGPRIDPFTGRQRQHRGIDFAARTGSEVIAVGAGIVTWTGYRKGYGQMVEIAHGDGYVTRYAHNSRNLVATGETVRQGDTIALVGATGRATGSNLHFEVWHRGRPVDPRRFIRQTG